MKKYFEYNSNKKKVVVHTPLDFLALHVKNVNFYEISNGKGWGMGPKEGNLLQGKIIDIGYIFFSLER